MGEGDRGSVYTYILLERRESAGSGGVGKVDGPLQVACKLERGVTAHRAAHHDAAAPLDGVQQRQSSTYLPITRWYTIAHNNVERVMSVEQLTRVHKISDEDSVDRQDYVAQEKPPPCH